MNYGRISLQRMNGQPLSLRTRDYGASKSKKSVFHGHKSEDTKIEELKCELLESILFDIFNVKILDNGYKRHMTPDEVKLLLEGSDDDLFNIIIKTENTQDIRSLFSDNGKRSTQEIYFANFMPVFKEHSKKYFDVIFQRYQKSFFNK